MTDPRDPYEILQVSPKAEIEVIEAAYRRLARKYHPDTNASADATQRMQDLNWAHELLKNPSERARYDRSRRSSHGPPPPRSASPPPPPPPARPSPPPPRKPKTSEPAPQPRSQPQGSGRPSFFRSNWVWIALILGAAYLIMKPQADTATTGIGASGIANQISSIGPTLDTYADCVPWTSAGLYDGQTECVLGRIVVVTYDFDIPSSSDVWAAHFSFGKHPDFSLISVNRDITQWQGRCVAVYGTLMDRTSIRDYVQDPEPSMVDSDPFEGRGFTITSAPDDKCP